MEIKTDNAPPLLWNAETSYGPITGSGAEKLASSQVAPLVALARGYATLLPNDVTEFVDKVLCVPSRQSPKARQVRNAVGDYDALVMPWFTPERTVDCQRQGDELPASVLQYRPHPVNVRSDDKGKAQKYVNTVGDGLVLDVHPSTPARFINEPIKTLFVAEGLLKADSALTAYLMHNGYSVEDLSLKYEDLQGRNARLRLREMLLAVPEKRRFVILGVVGVGTWHSKAEWNSLNVQGGSVLVAFDGDVGTNGNVWRQATQMFRFIESKKASPYLVDLSAYLTPDGGKVGVDDFLAGGKTWEELTSLVKAEVPPKPEDLSDNDAKFKISSDGCSMDARVDTEGGSRWVPAIDFGGRVVSTQIVCTIAEEEELTGRFDPGAHSSDSSICTVEVSWRDSDGEIQRGFIRGPETMLGQKPETWANKSPHIQIDSRILRLPKWPPPGFDWLTAVKAHRSDEHFESVVWEHMGWVPRPDDPTPVYLVGSQVVGHEGFVESPLVQCGLTEGELAGVRSFGVDLPEDDEQARQDLKKVVELYSGCWRDKKNTAMVLAAALRPTVPLVSRVPVVLSGKTGAGKSYTSAAIMAFWQAWPGAWRLDALGGSANDTYAATEIALHLTPLWVMDDLAPSSASRRTQEEAREKMNALIRNVFNGQARRRSTQSGLSSQKVNKPRALFISSCEAPPTDSSILNRLVHIEVVGGEGNFLVKDRAPTNALVKMNGSDLVASRVTGYILRMIARSAKANGWTETVNFWKGRLEMHIGDTEAVIEQKMEDEGLSKDPNKDGPSTRMLKRTADLLLGLDVLLMMASEVGASEEEEALHQLKVDLQESLVEEMRAASTYDAALVFLSTLRSVLSSGAAHIAAAGVPGAPVLVSDKLSAEQAALRNQQLGWTLTDDKSRPDTPKGPAIGTLVYHNDVPVVLFDPKSAFDAARMNDGHTKRSIWDLVWTSGFVYDSWKRDGANLVVRPSVNGNRIPGVPLTLDTLMAMP